MMTGMEAFTRLFGKVARTRLAEPQARILTMSQAMESASVSTPISSDDLVTAIHCVLKESTEPLTVSKIRAQLPTQFRSLNIEELMQRQVAANALQLYPKYRS